MKWNQRRRQKEEIIYTKNHSIFGLYTDIQKRWAVIPGPKDYRPHVDISDIIWKGMMPVRGTVGSFYSGDYVKARFLPSVENPYDADMPVFLDSLINVYDEPSDHQRTVQGSLHYKIKVGADDDDGNPKVVAVMLAFDHIEASRKESKYKRSHN